MNETMTAHAPESLPSLTSTSHIKLHPFSFRLEGEEYLVSCPEYSIYLSMPHIGVEALQLLQQGQTIHDVSLCLQGDDEHPPDIIDFVQMMQENGLVAEIDGYPVPPLMPNAQAKPGIELARRIQGKHVRWLFGKPAYVVYAALLVTTVLLLWRHPQQIPQMMNMMMFSPWFTVNVLIMVATIWVLALIHELAHIFAARAFGANARLSLGNRLYYLVSQSSVENIWQLSRFQRYAVYLAGLTANLVVFCVALVVVLWRGPTLPMLVYSWLEVVLVMEWFATGWQFLFYMKTDVYFLIADLFQTRNLMDDAKAYLGYVFAKLFPGKFLGRDLSDLPPRERLFVKIYTGLYVVGLGYACYLVMTVIGPFLLGMLVPSIQTLAMGSSIDLGHWLDAAFTLALYTGYVILIVSLLWRQRPYFLFRSKSPSLSPVSSDVQ